MIASKLTPDFDRKSGLPTKALRQASLNGKFEGEGWRVRKDGSQFWATVVIYPIHGDSGTLIGFAKVTRDETERHQAQDLLEQKNKDLEILTARLRRERNNKPADPRASYAGDVAAGTIKAFDKPVSQGIGARRKDNRNRCPHYFGCARGRQRVERYDDRRPAPSRAVRAIVTMCGSARRRLEAASMSAYDPKQTSTSGWESHWVMIHAVR